MLMNFEKRGFVWTVVNNSHSILCIINVYIFFLMNGSRSTSVKTVFAFFCHWLCMNLWKTGVKNSTSRIIAEVILNENVALKLPMVEKMAWMKILRNSLISN